MFKYYLVIIFFIVILYDNLNAQDSIFTPPNPYGRTPLFISIVVNNISEINAATQVMTADIFLIIKWKDPRLAHTSKVNVIKSLDEIWTPLITIANRFNVNKTFPEAATILSDGTAIYLQRIYGNFSQDFHLKEFPFDIQSFYIRLVAEGFSASEIEIIPDTEYQSGISDKFSMPDWKIIDWEYNKEWFSFLKDSPLLPALTFTFRAKREPGFYLLVFVIPLVLIIVMSWMAFWLDPKLSSSQISIATTSMLTLIAYRFVVSGSLPKISYMTRMDIFVLGSSILIFFTLLQAVITASLTSKTLGRKFDIHSRWIFPLLYIIICFIAFVF